MARTTEEILEDFRDIECDMSPENLTCDGEACRSYVQAKIKALNARKDILIEELGRTPDDCELWPELYKNN